MRKCVFVWFWTKNGRTYAKRCSESTAPAVIAQLRWDGGFGTFGGKVDPGEGLVDALVREVHEETSVDIGIMTSMLVPIAVCVEAGWEIHSYSLELDSTAFYKLVEVSATQARETGESCGVVAVSLTKHYPDDHDGPTGLERFLQNRFHGSGKTEFVQLVQNIEHICNGK